MSETEGRLHWPLAQKPIFANPFFRDYFGNPNFKTKRVYDAEEVNPMVDQTPEELEELKDTKKIDFNDLTSEETLKLCLWATKYAPCIHMSESRRMTLTEMCEAYPERSPYVIEGLLRKGEIGNIISSSKVGKSWLSLYIAICVALGRPLFGRFKCAQGKVLLIDNELQSPELPWRIKEVAKALMIPVHVIGSLIEIISLRGRMVDIDGLNHEIEDVQPGEFKLIILDALYKTLPPRTDENDNGAMSQIYNKLDLYTRLLDAPIIIVHHSTKGNQALKNVADVGAGAGAQTRACDTHIILRAHEDENCAVMEALMRSSPPTEPLGVRWAFPLWKPDKEIDATRLKGAEEVERTAAEVRKTAAARKIIQSGLITSTATAWRDLLAKSKSPPWNMVIGENKFKDILKSMAYEGLIVQDNSQGARMDSYRLRLPSDPPPTLREATTPQINPNVDLNKVIPLDTPKPPANAEPQAPEEPEPPEDEGDADEGAPF